MLEDTTRSALLPLSENSSAGSDDDGRRAPGKEEKREA
jgi:hypothetical protein